MSSKKPKALLLEGDPEQIRKAIKRVQEAGYDLSRPSPHQLKVGPVNFYPTTGTITIDPKSRHPKNGLDAFLDLIVNLLGPARLTIETRYDE